MPSSTSFLLLALCTLVFLPSVSAFGAGEIPDFAYLNDKAFRHLDIENILVNIVRWTGSNTGGVMGLLSSVTGGGEKKFTKADVHRIYFGNWLRDYSQAMDIAGLSKATSETIILLLSVLSFMTFGYGTEEFELKAERLGVYLPVEHITFFPGIRLTLLAGYNYSWAFCRKLIVEAPFADNPKGYGGGEDPRKYHPKLRGPIDPRELEIDPRTGLKNYIANDGQGWDTSAAHVRRSLEKAIQLARQSGGHRSPELYEAYRLMGGALHTLEDLLAHSNWVELSLNKMGCRDVFTHVGDSVTVLAPGGQRVPPLVTGTFGSADFIFSVMGEAGDKLSESSVSELSKKVSDAQGKQGSLASVKNIIDQVPSGGEDTQAEMKKADEIQAKAYSFDPDNYTTEDVQQTLWEVLTWRDTIMRKISTIIEKIPGMETVLDQLTEALNVYIYTTIEPYVKPVLGTASDAIGQGSRLVIDQDDQYEVFNNGNASDPSHSMISKDHFDNLLNNSAGCVAKVVIEVAVHKIVAAWSDNNVDVRRTIDEILQAFHHPYFADERSEIQMAMQQTIKKWYDGLGNDRQETLSRLSKESVRNGENKRLGADKNTPMHSHTIAGAKHSSGHGPSYQAPYSGGSGHHQQPQARGGNQRDEDPRRAGRAPDYGQQQQQQTSSYGGQESRTYGQQESRGYGQSESRHEEDPRRAGRAPAYGQEQQTSSYGQQESRGYGQSESRKEEDPRRAGRTPAYGQEQQTSSYGQPESRTYGQQESRGYGQSESRDEEEPRHTGRTAYGREETHETSSYGGHGEETYGQSAGFESQSSGGYDRSSGRVGHQSGRRQEEEESGYGGGRRTQDDTYGVERLDLGGENRSGGGPSGYGGNSGGYGGNSRGYEQETNKHQKHQKKYGAGSDDEEEEKKQKKHYKAQREDSGDDEDEGKTQRKQHKKSDDDSDEDDYKKQKKYRQKRRDDD